MYSLRTQVWHELNEAERRIRYYDRIYRRCNLISSVLRGLILVSGMSSIAALLEVFPAYIGVIISAILCIIIVVDFTIRYEEKSTILAVSGSETQKIYKELQSLWVEVEKNYHRLDDDTIQADIQQKYDRIVLRMAEIESWGRTSKVPVSKKLARKAEKEADDVMEGYIHA